MTLSNINSGPDEQIYDTLEQSINYSINKQVRRTIARALDIFRDSAMGPSCYVMEKQKIVDSRLENFNNLNPDRPQRIDGPLDTPPFTAPQSIAYIARNLIYVLQRTMLMMSMKINKFKIKMSSIKLKTKY